MQNPKEPTERPLATIHVVDRFRTTLPNIESLANSMAKRGLLQPILILRDGTLVAGYRRVEAARRLGWETIAVRIYDGADVRGAEVDENMERDDLTPSERVAVAEHFRPIVEEEAREHQRVAGPESGRGAKRTGSAKPVKAIRVDEVLATKVRWSRQTLRDAERVVEAARQRPAFQWIVTLMDRSGNVAAAVRRLKATVNLHRQFSAGKLLPNTPQLALFDQKAVFRIQANAIAASIEKAVNSLVAVWHYAEGFVKENAVDLPDDARRRIARALQQAADRCRELLEPDATPGTPLLLDVETDGIASSEQA